MCIFTRTNLSRKSESVHNIQRIGILTSGGDAPGMNACIRACVRTALSQGLKVTGIQQGYQGILDKQFVEMNSRSVSNIIQLGGTILKTARCLEFRDPSGRKLAYEHIKEAGIDALIGIGGDGTFTGLELLSREFDLPVIGIPGTIDNDLFGSDYTLGFDTASNTVIEAIDKIRDTAASHDRLFFVEVMGRDSGYIALHAGIAGGAEAILLPETATAIEDLIVQLEKAAAGNKSSTIVIVAEGDQNGGAYNVARHVKERFDFYDIKVTILGHLQRGGAPSSADRVLGSRLGYAAVNLLLSGASRKMVGIRGQEVKHIPLKEALEYKKFALPKDLMEISQVLAI